MQNSTAQKKVYLVRLLCLKMVYRIKFAVLWYRPKEGVLTFPLCAKCAEEQNQGECSHSDFERSLVGDWPVVEVQEAVYRGYIIQEVLASPIGILNKII